MAKSRGRKGNKAWTVISVIIIILLAAAVVGLSIGLSNRITDHTLTSLAFEVGSLDETTGEEVDSDSAVRTRTYWTTEDMTISAAEDLDELTVTYQVFYYDEDKNFVSVTESLSDTFAGEIPETAAYFKLLITPVPEEVAEGEEAKEVTISWTEVSAYSNQLVVTVAR